MNFDLPPLQPVSTSSRTANAVELATSSHRYRARRGRLVPLPLSTSRPRNHGRHCTSTWAVEGSPKTNWSLELCVEGALRRPTDGPERRYSHKIDRPRAISRCRTDTRSLCSTSRTRCRLDLARPCIPSRSATPSSRALVKLGTNIARDCSQVRRIDLSLLPLNIRHERAGCE